LAEVAGSRPAARLRTRFRWLSDGLLGTFFLSPTLILLLFVTVFPLIWSLYLSFTSYGVIRDPEWTKAAWIGLQNYIELLKSEKLWGRFALSAAFVVPTVTLEFLLGFGIALLLNREFAGRGFISTIILIPMMLTPVVVGLFWRFMFQADSGVINYFLVTLFGERARVLWFDRSLTAMATLVIVDTWQWTPFMILISLAGLTAVPKYLYEAAQVDRASGWFRFRHITLPIVWPLLLIGIIFRLMDTYKLFDLAWVLTGGGPGESTKLVPIHLYLTAFSNFDTGRASAMGYIMLVVVIALANLLIRVLNQARGGSNA
jgi:multiple sugar transport system permease protein